MVPMPFCGIFPSVFLGKVSYNTIGWVKSARASNGWVTSLSYAPDCAPKALINSAGRFIIVNLELHQYLPFLQSCYNEIGNT